MTKRSLFPAIQMTSACNKRCRTCLRPPEEKSYTITYDTFIKYIDDLRMLSSCRDVKYQFVTGGEPTLWRDGDMDIVDILAACHDLRFLGLVTMPTNGKRFENRDYARDFVARLSAKVTRPTIVGISIATYQNNLTTNGCVALDNLLLACTQEGAQVVPIILVTLSAQDDTYERLQQLYPHVAKRVTALAPLGVASGAVNECPSLGLNGADKTPLGSYLPLFRRDVMGKLRLTEKAFNEMPNAELLDKLSLFNNCGDSPFIDDRWRYCLPFREDARFDLGAIGTIKGDSLDHFLKRHPSLCAIRELGVLSAAKTYKHRLTSATAQKLEELLSGETLVSVAYRGCMLCKKLGEIGVIDEMLALSNHTKSCIRSRG
jgi:uncharacterized Fe-S cluster-containing radical SAM superfamily protein